MGCGGMEGGILVGSSTIFPNCFHPIKIFQSEAATQFLATSALRSDDYC